MTALAIALTLSGLVLAGLGAYLLGKRVAASRYGRLSEELEDARARVSELEEKNRYHELRDEMAFLTAETVPPDPGLEDDPTEVNAEPPTPRPVSRSSAGPPAPPPYATGPSPPPSAFALGPSSPSVPGVDDRDLTPEVVPTDMSGEIDLVEKGVGFDPRISASSKPIVTDDQMEAFREDLEESEKTRKINISSTHDMLNLSDQVELLTDDLAHIHKELSRSRARAQDAEGQSLEWRKRVAELESLTEKLRAELRRRDEKMRHLMAEVGVAVTSGLDVAAALDAMETQDSTHRMKKMDVDEVDHAADELRFRGPPKPGLVSQVGPAPDAAEVETTNEWAKVESPTDSRVDTEPEPLYVHAKTVPEVPAMKGIPPTPPSDGWDAVLEGVDDEEEPDEPGDGPGSPVRSNRKDAKLPPPTRR